jgi:hypothetical protein
MEHTLHSELHQILGQSRFTDEEQKNLSVFQLSTASPKFWPLFDKWLPKAGIRCKFVEKTTSQGIFIFRVHHVGISTDS